MPFDSLSFEDVKVPTFNFATATPEERLLELARLLDNKQEWEDKMFWDFGHVIHQDECGTSGCALGLSHIFWPEFAERSYEIGHFNAARELFNLRGAEDTVFASLTPGHGNRVQPGDVAKAIRRVIAHRKKPVRRLWDSLSHHVLPPRGHTTYLGASHE